MQTLRVSVRAEGPVHVIRFSDNLADECAAPSNGEDLQVQLQRHQLELAAVDGELTRYQDEKGILINMLLDSGHGGAPPVGGDPGGGGSRVSGGLYGDAALGDAAAAERATSEAGEADESKPKMQTLMGHLFPLKSKFSRSFAARQPLARQPSAASSSGALASAAESAAAALVKTQGRETPSSVHSGSQVARRSLTWLARPRSSNGVHTSLERNSLDARKLPELLGHARPEGLATSQFNAAAVPCGADSPGPRTRTESFHDPRPAGVSTDGHSAGVSDARPSAMSVFEYSASFHDAEPTFRASGGGTASLADSRVSSYGHSLPLPPALPPLGDDDARPLGEARSQRHSSEAMSASEALAEPSSSLDVDGTGQLHTLVTPLAQHSSSGTGSPVVDALQSKPSLDAAEASSDSVQIRLARAARMLVPSSTLTWSTARRSERPVSDAAATDGARNLNSSRKRVAFFTAARMSGALGNSRRIGRGSKFPQAANLPEAWEEAGEDSDGSEGVLASHPSAAVCTSFFVHLPQLRHKVDSVHLFLCPPVAVATRNL